MLPAHPADMLDRADELHLCAEHPRANSVEVADAQAHHWPGGGLLRQGLTGQREDVIEPPCGSRAFDVAE